MEFLRLSLKNILNGFFLFFFCFFFVLSFVRLDAELLIFLSVFLVIFAVWNTLSDFLAKLLFVKMTYYYYYFVRYYQGRIWLIYLLSRFSSFYLYSKRLPYFIRWYKLYIGRFNLLCDTNFTNLVNVWDNFLSLYVYESYLNMLSLVWINYYKSYISLFSKYAIENVDFFDNNRKLTEYILSNKINLDI